RDWACRSACGQARLRVCTAVRGACRPREAARRTRQINPLARLDPMRTAYAPAIGRVDALVAPAGAVVAFRNAPERVALLDDIPARKLDRGSGRRAGVRLRGCSNAPALGSSDPDMSAFFGPRRRRLAALYRLQLTGVAGLGRIASLDRLFRLALGG